MKLSTIISVCVATLAIAGIVVAFLGASSPYLTVAEAKSSDGRKGVHVVGVLDKKSLSSDIRAGRTTFAISDEKTGEIMNVEYHGPPVQNLTAADKVVVVGSDAKDCFMAEKILVKCPSKYEGQKN